MASELYVQQIVPGGYHVATANETGLTADKHGWYYTFPDQYGAVDIYGYSFRADSIATLNTALGNIVPAAVFSVFDQDENNFLNGYFPAPASEIYGTTIGLCGLAVLDTPIRVGHYETVNVGFPDIVATTEAGGFSVFNSFMFNPAG